MATTVPAMKGKMGDIDYYVISMKAGEVIKTLKIPRDISGWQNLTIDERYQRDINYKRVRDHIAPYLVNSPSRFFGALIVTILNSDIRPLSFNALKSIGLKNDHPSYEGAMETVGFLTLHGEEIIVPLDGQHRFKALEFAITGQDHKGDPIPGIAKPCTELASEDIVLMLVDPVRDKTETIRRIFTRVNLTARRPTTGENIVTNDDDIVAVLAREIASEEIDEDVMIGSELVKYKSNTLTSNDPHFTTLAIVYNINQEIIKAYFPPPLITTELPPVEIQEEYRQKCREVWSFMLQNIATFREILGDLGSTGNKLRVDIRKGNLLGKPVAQECLFRAFLKLTNKPNNLSEKEAAERLNTLPWLITDDNMSRYWENVLWIGKAEGGKILTKNRTLTTQLIEWLAGGIFSRNQKQEFEKAYAELFSADEGGGSRKLPERVCPVIRRQ